APPSGVETPAGRTSSFVPRFESLPQPANPSTPAASAASIVVKGWGCISRTPTTRGGLGNVCPSQNGGPSGGALGARAGEGRRIFVLTCTLRQVPPFGDAARCGPKRAERAK